MKTRGKSKKNNDGVAMILALLFVVLLSALVVEFSYDSQVDASLATNFGRDFEAYLAAKSAVHDGMGILQENIVTYLQGTPGGGAPQNVGEYYDGADQTWYTGAAFSPMNDANMRATIRDEYGKINLNALLSYGQGDQPQENTPLIEAVRYFFDRRTDSDAGLDITDEILDWLDYGKDDDERENGAENDYYMGLDPPYSAKNGPMDSIEELLLIPGITPEIYFGDPTLDPPQKALSEYFTVNGNYVGDVNINTAETEVIESVLVGYFGEGAAQSVMESLYTASQDARPNPLNGLPIYDSQGVLDRIVGQAAQQYGQNSQQQSQQQQQPQFNTGQSGAGVRQKQDKAGSLDKQTLQRREPTPGQNPNQNLPQGNGPGFGGGHIFITTSNVFRIYGDGESGEALVRIEAYVLRTMSINDTNFLPPPGATQENFTAPQESFRVLDWKVIR